MSAYKIVKMNTTVGPRFTLNRVEPASKEQFNGKPLYAERLVPISAGTYYKTKKGAEKALQKRISLFG